MPIISGTLALRQMMRTRKLFLKSFLVLVVKMLMRMIEMMVITNSHADYSRDAGAAADAAFLEELPRPRCHDVDENDQNEDNHFKCNNPGMLALQQPVLMMRTRKLFLKSFLNPHNVDEKNDDHHCPIPILNPISQGRRRRRSCS